VFDVDALVADCQAAIADAEPRRAIRAVLERAIAHCPAMADALRPTEGGLEFLHDPDAPRRLLESGGKDIGAGDVVVLGDDVIHAVANPADRLTGAIHVYGGDFVNQPRSQWGPGPREERPHDMNLLRQQFADANRAWKSAER
jgi:hypothetical protein